MADESWTISGVTTSSRVSAEILHGCDDKQIAEIVAHIVDNPDSDVDSVIEEFAGDR